MLDLENKQKDLVQKLINLYNEIEVLKEDIKQVKEDAEVDLEKGDISIADKVAKTFVADKFEDQKEKWESFEDSYVTLVG